MTCGGELMITRGWCHNGSGGKGSPDFAAHEIGGNGCGGRSVQSQTTNASVIRRAHPGEMAGKVLTRLGKVAGGFGRVEEASAVSFEILSPKLSTREEPDRCQRAERHSTTSAAAV